MVSGTAGQDPPASPAEPSPSALPRFKANPDGKGVAGGPGEGGKAPSVANRRRRKSISLIPPRWNPLLFYPSLFFTENSLNERVSYGTRTPFNVLVHVYIFI